MILDNVILQFILQNDLTIIVLVPLRFVLVAVCFSLAAVFILSMHSIVKIQIRFLTLVDSFDGEYARGTEGYFVEGGCVLGNIRNALCVQVLFHRAVWLGEVVVSFPDLDLVAGCRLVAFDIASRRITASMIRTLALRTVRRAIVVDLLNASALYEESVLVAA